MVKSKEEIENEAVIPAELKDKLAEKAKMVLTNIGNIEKAIDNAIDDTVETSENPITISEIYAALFNTLNKFSKQEIMQLVK
jgi:hypothetical protein